jgi:uncharacterized protein
MTLYDRLLNDMKVAMKDKEGSRLKLAVIRMVRASLQNAQIEKKRPLTEEEVLDQVVREMKLRQDAIDSIPVNEREHRQSYIAQLEEEKTILQEYLPEPLTPEELQQIVAEAIAEVNAVSPKDMGRVMGVLMPRVKGKADGKAVNSLVKQMLVPREE